MFSLAIDFRNPDWPVLGTSLLAFLLAFVPPVLSEIVYYKFNLLVFVWIMVPVAFHEVGHMLFGFFVSAPLSMVPQLAHLAEPMLYLGGFLFNAVAGLVLLWFSLLLQSRLSTGQLPQRHRFPAFSFLIIAYLNLYMVPHTLTHLSHVVGPGLDFTTASSLLKIPLNELIGWMWVVHWITFALAVFLNVFFIFRKRG